MAKFDALKEDSPHYGVHTKGNTSTPMGLTLTYPQKTGVKRVPSILMQPDASIGRSISQRGIVGSTYVYTPSVAG